MEAKLRPSIPGFSIAEARELLGMCTVANYLGPAVFVPFPQNLHPTDDPLDPLPGDDGKTYPWPDARIWPEGWGPGVPSEPATSPWHRSIIVSQLSNGVGVNGAIVAHNADRNAYAIAFAGSLNTGSAMEDLCALLLTAGPLTTQWLTSTESYISYFPVHETEAAGGPIATPITEPETQPPLVHLGYRVAVETLALQGQPNSLKSILSGIEGEEIDLYVTGHSLGAAAAQLFSSWVKAGGIQGKKINVKCYAFATPRSCNTPMALNHALALGNDGFSFNINNTLDTSQQLPPTKDQPSDLINPGISTDLTTKAKPVGQYEASPLASLANLILSSETPPQLPFPLCLMSSALKLLEEVMQGGGSSSAPGSHPNSMSFVGMGVPHVLAAGPPVIYNGRCYPPELFPGREPGDLVVISDTTTREWWQHWPYTYARYLAAAAVEESLQDDDDTEEEDTPPPAGRPARAPARRGRGSTR